MLREYIISEAMAHLGVPTTRSLAVAVGEDVVRERDLPGGILTRLDFYMSGLVLLSLQLVKIIVIT